MKVVLDTNVFVAAAFNKESSSAQIIEAVEKGKLVMVWDEPTRKETKFIVDKIPPISWSKFEGLFGSESEFKGKTSPEKFKMVEDRDDRKFAALADAAGATLITNDDHLLEHKGKVEVAIMTPGEFWRG